MQEAFWIIPVILKYRFSKAKATLTVEMENNLDLLFVSIDKNLVALEFSIKIAEVDRSL